MKFVYFGYDFMLPAVKHLIAEGHELLGIFSFDCDNVFNFNTDCIALAQKQDVPFILSPAEDFHLKSFLDLNAEIFLAAGYPHKIPPIDEKQAYAVNVHPTHLPKARGLMPIPQIIMSHINEAAGFTAHKMTQKFDAGDILLQKKFDLDNRETVESYCEKIVARAPDMFAELFKNLPSLWDNAEPQNNDEATYLKPPADAERLFQWNKTVQEIDAVGRAFGHFGSLAQFNEQTWVVYDYAIKEEKHDLKPGEIAKQQEQEITIAAKNGFIHLKEFQKVQTG